MQKPTGKIHYLITCVDSHEKHGLEGLVIRKNSEVEAYRAMAEWAPILAEEWELLVYAICRVGGPNDPHEDGERISTRFFSGPKRGDDLRAEMLFKADWVGATELDPKYF